MAVLMDCGYSLPDLLLPWAPALSLPSGMLTRPHRIYLSGTVRGPKQGSRFYNTTTVFTDSGVGRVMMPFNASGIDSNGNFTVVVTGSSLSDKVTFNFDDTSENFVRKSLIPVPCLVMLTPVIFIQQHQKKHTGLVNLLNTK
jgi:hypothetical protein